MLAVNQKKTVTPSRIRNRFRHAFRIVSALVFISIFISCADLDKGKDPVPPSVSLPVGYGQVTDPYFPHNYI